MKPYYLNTDECPIYNFRKVQSTGDVRWLLKVYDDKCTLTEIASLEIVFSEMLLTLPKGALNLESIFKEFELERLLFEFELTKNFNLKNRANRIQKEIENPKKATNESSFDDELASVSANLGFHIDKFKVTVNEYYAYLRMVIKKNTK